MAFGSESIFSEERNPPKCAFFLGEFVLAICHFHRSQPGKRSPFTTVAVVRHSGRTRGARGQAERPGSAGACLTSTGRGSLGGGALPDALTPATARGELVPSLRSHVLCVFHGHACRSPRRSRGREASAVVLGAGYYSVPCKRRCHVLPLCYLLCTPVS